MWPLRSAAILVLLAAVTAGAQTPGPQLVGPFTREDYPRALIDRPLTLPAGMVEGELGFDFVSQQTISPAFTGGYEDPGGADQWLTDVTIRAGITDRVQLAVGTAFSLAYRHRGAQIVQGVNPYDYRTSLTSWQRVVPLSLSVLAHDGTAVDVAPRLTIPFVALSSRYFPPVRGSSGGFTLSNATNVVPQVILDAPTRWRLCNWFWIRGGENLFSVTTDDPTATFAFDVGIGIQPHEIFAVTLDTQIADVSVKGDGGAGSTTLAEQGPILLTGTFVPYRWFDVVGQLAMSDAGSGFDDYTTRLAFRFRF